MATIGAHERTLVRCIAFTLWITSCVCMSGQVRDPIILHNADVLSGSESPYGPIRQLRGNVSLTQGNVSVKCDYALWNMNGNSIEMNGNVIIQQGTMTLSMPSGSYDGIQRLARGRGGVKVVDRGRTVKALYGDYSTATYLARFYGNVSVEDDSTLIYADSAYYERATRRSLAFGRVVVRGKLQPAIIEGAIAESMPNEGLTRITGRPILFLIDSIQSSTFNSSGDVQQSQKKLKMVKVGTTSSFVYDTMTIVADTLETTSGMGYLAKQQVEIIKSGMAAICEQAMFQSGDDSVQLIGQPIIWHDSTMMKADSITLIMRQRSLQRIDAHGAAFTLTRSDSLRPQRAQQLSGRHISLIMQGDTISRIESEGQAKSLYFLVSEQGNPEGAAKNVCDTIILRFESGDPESIIWIGGVQGEVYPEHEIVGKEQLFDLPGRPIERPKPKKRIRQFVQH